MGLFNLFKTADINSGLEEYKSQKGAVLLDVRELHEYAQGHIEGSINLPLDKLQCIAEVVCDKSTPIYVHCLSGARSREAVSLLAKAGYLNVKNIGGIGSYNGKIVKGD